MAAVNNKLYAIGGYNGLTNVEEYNPITNTWVWKNNSPTGRTITTAVSLNDKIYVAGYGTAFEAYDPATDTWQARADITSTSRRNSMLAAANGKVYSIGGYYIASGYYYSSKILNEYDPVSNSWALKSDMPTARSSGGAATVNGIVYVIGGFLISTSGTSTSVTTVEAYDPVTNSWTTKASMPIAKSHFGTAVVDNKIYIIGGFSNPTTYKTVEEYDPATDTWSTKASLPTNNNSLGAAEINGKIYAVGGYDGINTTLNTVKIFTP